jgi:uncharacterized membrane protein YkvA (DUF1232 family)
VVTLPCRNRLKPSKSDNILLHKAFPFLELSHYHYPMNLIEQIKNWARSLKKDVLILWFTAKNPKTPLAPKAICFFIVAYALSPIDLIPDFIPVLGYIDDLILLPILIWIVIQLIPNTIIQSSRTQAKEWLTQNLNPKSKFGLLIVIFIWAVMLYWAYHLIGLNFLKI